MSSHSRVRKYDESYIGNRYWNYTVIGFGDRHNFVCRCDCGNIKTVVPINLISGKVKSCGCKKRKYLSNAFTKHGATKGNGEPERIYRIWNQMHNRCYNKKSQKFKYYGERGIKICDDWKENYSNFKEWDLKNGYSDDLSIDRINVNGNYEPSNCRWATAKMQRENQRARSKYKTKNNFCINGVTKSAIDWCKEYNVSVPFVMYRINKKGMTPLDALTIPKGTLAIKKCVL